MPTGTVLDVTDATFATAVLEESKRRAVVVDFWAPWCGPCRMLGPIIERVAAEYGDDVAVVKLNTDENPQTAMQYRIQSIPAVKAFRDGKVLTEFIGALPEPQVRQFFSGLAPTPAEKAAREAEELAAADPVEAERRFRQLLQGSPNNADAIVGLAQVLLQRGALEEAEELLGRAPTDRRAKVLKHHLFLDGFAKRHAGEDIAGEARANPRDPRAQYRLGVLLAAAGHYEAALDALLESVRLDRGFADGAARKAALAVFDILGLDNPVTRHYQRKLSGVLF
ncbi:MAG: thioredoxin [Dehalococcoidia bacterium]|nr:thioredoxin [Dehalococcoidia bacterium]